MPLPKGRCAGAPSSLELGVGPVARGTRAATNSRNRRQPYSATSSICAMLSSAGAACALFKHSAHGRGITTTPSFRWHRRPELATIPQACGFVRRIRQAPIARPPSLAPLVSRSGPLPRTCFSPPPLLFFRRIARAPPGSATPPSRAGWAVSSQRTTLHSPVAV
jgi:hypothetical protein